MSRICWLVACLLLTAACGPSSEPGKSPSKPSVLIVTIDTLRADALGAYGAQPSPSPHLDALAAESTLYEQAHTTMPMTRPAHFSIFTSRYPREHGVLNNTMALPQAEETLAELFQQNGYRTGAFVSVAILARKSGAEQGFDVLQAANKKKKTHAVGSALAWLKTLSPSEPFFGWVHVFYPHQPYQQLDPKLGEVDAKMLRRFPALEWKDFYKVAKENDGDIPAAVLDHALALYRAEVAYTDQQIGRLLDGLAALRNLDDVIVVVTSDHGECFGNGVFFEHSDCMQEAALRVPLLIRYPESFEPGLRSDAVVSHIDIAPTLLEAAGIELPASFSGIPLQRIGKADDTRQILIQYPFYQQRAVQNRKIARRVIETVAGAPFSPVMLDQEKVGLVAKGWKYLRSGDREELYRLDGDMDDVHDRASDEINMRRQFFGDLDTLLKRHPLLVLDAAEINDELRETLEALGYIQ